MAREEEIFNKIRGEAKKRSRLIQKLSNNGHRPRLANKMNSVQKRMNKVEQKRLTKNVVDANNNAHFTRDSNSGAATAVPSN